MKHLIYIIGICFWNMLWSQPLLVVAIMVKNEEAVIQQTLEPYLKADPYGCDIAYLVFDTGSIDATLLKARELFERYGVKQYYLFQEPFIDFATSRNRALDLVEQQFPHAIFIVMPDAEWYISDVAGLLAYCKKEVYNTFGPYFIKIQGPALNFFVPRLIRQSMHSRFKGVVHEALTVYAEQIPYTRLPESIYFDYRPSIQGQEKSQKRYMRDRDLLLHAYQKDPHDTQTTFYLAQTYEYLNDWPNAYKYYTLRAEQSGWDEDNFLAHYKRAYAAQQLINEYALPWDTIHGLYLTSYSMRPTRIEPLIRIALYYYNHNNMPLAYLYTSFALDIPYPVQDTHFIEKEFYFGTRYLLLAASAWYLKEYQRGYSALKLAVASNLDSPSLKEIIKLYEAAGFLV
jgi:glycosyltransferase involved in cell wall biosynthesis